MVRIRLYSIVAAAIVLAFAGSVLAQGISTGPLEMGKIKPMPKWQQQQFYQTVQQQSPDQAQKLNPEKGYCAYDQSGKVRYYMLLPTQVPSQGQDGFLGVIGIGSYQKPDKIYGIQGVQQGQQVQYLPLQKVPGKKSIGTEFPGAPEWPKGKVYIRPNKMTQQFQQQQQQGQFQQQIPTKPPVKPPVTQQFQVGWSKQKPIESEGGYLCIQGQTPDQGQWIMRLPPEVVQGQWQGKPPVKPPPVKPPVKKPPVKPPVKKPPVKY